jgi:TrmH family RNA methyltransferase
MPNVSDLNFIPHGSTYLMLDNINDPGNMGTIIRTAEWFGVQALITSPNSVDVWNPKVVQASMGSVFRMPIYQLPIRDAVLAAKEAGISWIVGGVLSGQSLEVLDRQHESMVLVIGSESHGISPEVLSELTHYITIARHSNAPTESLNASVATGILLHHFCNQ